MPRCVSSGLQPLLQLLALLSVNCAAILLVIYGTNLVPGFKGTCIGAGGAARRGDTKFRRRRTILLQVINFNPSGYTKFDKTALL